MYVRRASGSPLRSVDTGRVTTSGPMFSLRPGVGRYVLNFIGSFGFEQELRKVIERSIGYDASITSTCFLEVMLDAVPEFGAEFAFCDCY